MRSLLACLVLAAMVPALGQAQGKDVLPDTPKNHWVYEALADFRSEGFLAGYPDGLGKGIKPIGRYEMAVGAHAATKNLQSLCSSLAYLNRRIATSSDSGERRADLVRLLKAAERLSKSAVELFVFFESELKELGVDTAAEIRQVRIDASKFKTFRIASVGEALQPFADLPSGHWAARATSDLRKAGVLTGYPSGKLGGGKG